MRALVIGDLEVTRATCAMLSDRGVDVVHLLQPSDVGVRARLDASVDAVAVLVRGDVTALRYVLLVEQIRPGVRLAATVFDRTLAERLATVVPNCSVDSPADVSVPSIAAACLGDDTLAVDFSEPMPRRLVRDGEGDLHLLPWDGRGRSASRSLGFVGRLAAHDDATRVLLLGLAGLLSILLADWVLLALVLHASPPEALYGAARVVTTVGPGEADREGETWYLVLASVFMLVTVIFTALFTAATVERVMSNRALTLVGRRVPPRRDHVVIVGLGQVGLRLANALRQLGIGVLVVERDPAAANLRLARASGIPVVVGDGHDVSVLRRVGIHRARAVAAMASADLDNIEVAIAASAVAPEIPVALRAGEDDLIAETRSLFRIGEVRNVSGLTAAAVVERLHRSGTVVAFVEQDRLATFDGASEVVITGVRRCGCTAG